MKTVKLSPEKLKKLSVEVTESGFILWMNISDKERRWLLDGSMVFLSGMIHIADCPDSASPFSVSIVPIQSKENMEKLFTDLLLNETVDL